MTWISKKGLGKFSLGGLRVLWSLGFEVVLETKCRERYLMGV